MVGKSPRPARPTAAPTTTRKHLPETDIESVKFSKEEKAPSRSSPPRDKVQMRNKQNAERAPPRPNTVATGKLNNWQFFGHALKDNSYSGILITIL